MTDVGELAIHYSTKAYQVRVAALTFAGAVLVASAQYFTETADSNVMGTALILVVTSLSALNHRYTHSYLCACNAMTADLSDCGVPSSEAELRWEVFRCPNERPYRHWTARLLLSWSTFGPGIVGGVYLVVRNGTSSVSSIGYVGLGVAGVATVIMLFLPWRTLNYDVDLGSDRKQYVRASAQEAV